MTFDLSDLILLMKGFSWQMNGKKSKKNFFQVFRLGKKYSFITSRFSNCFDSINFLRN